MDGRREFPRNRGGRSRGRRGQSPRIPAPQPSRSRGNAANNQQSPGNGRSPGQGNTGFRSPFNQAEQWRSPSVPDFEDNSWTSNSEFSRNRGGRSPGRRGQGPRIPALQPSRSRGNAANNQRSQGNARSPGQGNTGYRSPLNQAEQRRSPRVPDFEDDSRSGAAGNCDTTASDYSDNFSTCESNCDCMLCFAEAADDGLINGQVEQAESDDGSRNVDEQLDEILNKIPLPFVKIWRFTNEIEPDLHVKFSRIMKGYIRAIEAALQFAVSAEDIESRLHEVMRRRAQELPPDTPFFVKIANPFYRMYEDTAESSSIYVVPTVIFRYAFEVKNKVPLCTLGEVLARMMFSQDNKAPNIPDDPYPYQAEMFRDFWRQYEDYVDYREDLLRQKINARIQATRLNSRSQQRPGQPRSPRQQKSLRQQENLKQPQNVEQQQRPVQLLPPNWRTRIPELPVELRYMMAMVQDYERNGPHRLLKDNTYFNMNDFRDVISAYCLKMLRDCLHVSLEDIQYDDEDVKEEIRHGISYLEMKATEANDLEAANGVLWREKLPSLGISQRVPNHILELDAFMKGMHHVRKDYSTDLRYLFGGLMAEARRAETGVYPRFYAREELRRLYILQCEEAEKARSR